jgi:hypothetical protein
MAAWPSGSSNDIMEPGRDTRSSHLRTTISGKHASSTGAELHHATPGRSILRLPLLTLWGRTDCNTAAGFTKRRKAHLRRVITLVAGICSKRYAVMLAAMLVVGARNYPLHLNLINETGAHDTGQPTFGTARRRPDMLAAV